MEVRLPKGEVAWIEYTVGGVPLFEITSKPSRDCYFLYEVLENGTLKKLGRGRTPRDLEEKFHVEAQVLGHA